MTVPALDTAKAYYDQVMPLLGFTPFFVAENEFSYRPADGKPGAFIVVYSESDSGRSTRDTAQGRSTWPSWLPRGRRYVQCTTACELEAVCHRDTN